MASQTRRRASWRAPSAHGRAVRAPFETRQETIRVKDGDDVELRVRETHHGPIVSDTIDGSSDFLPAGHAVAFAWTALREMREETGLLFGKTGDDNSATESEAHDAYQRAGLVPNLTALDYLMRACTPEYQPIRFNTRFFVADGADTSGKIWQTSELEEICWVRLNELPDMKIASITGIVIEQAQQYWCNQPSPDPDRTVMFFSADMDHNRIWQEE